MAGHELLPPFQSNVHQQLSQSVYSTPPLYSSPSFEATHVTETQHAHPPAQFAQAYPLSRSGSRDSTASTSAYSHSLTPDTEAYGSVHSSHSDSQTSLATTEVTRTAQHLLHPQERPSAVNQPRQPPYYGHLAAGSPVSYSIPPSTFQPPQVKREYNEDDGNSDEEGSPEPKATKETAGKRTRAELSGVRTSSRIASMGRTSYADLENGTTPSPTASFNGRLSEPPTEDEEDDFRPQKRTRAPSSKKKAPVRRSSAAPAPAPSQVPQIEPCERSLWALNDTYPQLQKLYPLFYHALNDDLSLNMEAVPLIGTIPSTVTPHEKADRLRAFHHRGRRILAQLDAFTRRCDRRYEGESVRWPEIADGVRVAIRDVRRKAVERCENYKYTRRDILDKVCGKDNWDPVEVGMIEWREGMADNDPALDLKGGRMDGAPQLLRPAHEPVVSYRPVRPMPSRGRLVSRSASTVGIPRQQQHVGTKKATGPDTMAYEQINSPPPPRYGEDEVPLTVQMPGLSSPAVTHRESPQNQKPTLVVGTSTWPQDSNLWDDNEVVVPTASPQRGGSDDSFGSGWSP
ncbi:hypothetical protein Q8F55_000393 [Vanrija albida]|uniref:BAG domain-containing protein n=1 Tax=Vanrija albida TaxID=181172 RepID=A0ABR3QD52_9TREE